MDALIIILLIVWAVVSSKKKKAAADAKKRSAKTTGGANSSAPAGSASDVFGFPRNSEIFPLEGESAGDAGRHVVRPLTESSHSHTESGVPSAPVGTPARHVLEASFISGHAHTESSMTGDEEPCQPVASARLVSVLKSAAVKKDAETSSASAKRSVVPSFPPDLHTVGQAMIYNEILGTPKALRRD